MLFIGAASVGALSLVGVGAGAAFTSTATVNQTASTGHTGLTLFENNLKCSSDGNPCNGAAGDAAVGIPTGNGTANLRLAPISNLGSTFSFSYVITLTNSGSLTLKTADLSVANTAAGAALAAQTVVTVTTPTSPTDSTPIPVYKGTLAAAESGFNGVSNEPLPTGFVPGQTDTVTVTFASQSGGLTNAAQSNTITPTVTITASDA